MALKFPESTDECVYFTRRAIGKGKTIAWVFKEKCPKCKKAFMGKPKDEKTGKVKIRAKEYVCSECGNTVEKKAYEESLMCNVQYTCPACGKSEEQQVLFKRKKVKIFDEEEGKEKTGDAVQIVCSCGHKINITKKMK